MLQKLQHNSLKYLLLAGLLLWEGHAFSQEPNANNTAPEESKEIVEEHDTQDLEKLLKRYNTDQEKVLEDTSKIHNIQQDETTSEVKEADIDEMRPSDSLEKAKENAFKNAKKFKEEKDKEKAKLNVTSEYSDSVRTALEPLQKLSEGELLKILKERTKDSPVGRYYEQYPKVALYAVRLIRDKESIPSIVKIVENKERLIHFGSAMLCTIIFAFILKRIMHREGRSFLKAAFYFLVRFTVMSAIRVGVIYYFFNVELTPAAKVFKQTFMS